MEDLTIWDYGLIGIAGYIAITSLVRLMQRQRRVVLAELQKQVSDEKKAQSQKKDKKAGSPPSTKQSKAA